MVDIAVTNMHSYHLVCADSDIVARFNAKVGDFNINHALVRRKHSDGTVYITTPSAGNNVQVIRMDKSSPTFAALQKAALGLFYAKTRAARDGHFDDRTPV